MAIPELSELSLIIMTLDHAVCTCRHRFLAVKLTGSSMWQQLTGEDFTRLLNWRKKYAVLREEWGNVKHLESHLHVLLIG